MEDYPQPAFRFSVQWGGAKASFSEVSGLNIEIQAIEYRDGRDPDFGMKKMPGLPKYGNITLKRGIFKTDNEYYEWLDTIKMNTVQRRPLTIALLDEAGNSVMTWNVQEAFPVKIEGPGLHASGNAVAIESIELAHEGLTIGTP